MGLETIDPHCQNVHTKLKKIPKFDVNRPSSKQDTLFENNNNNNNNNNNSNNNNNNNKAGEAAEREKRR